jgi:hypothetical protein
LDRLARNDIIRAKRGGWGLYAEDGGKEKSSGGRRSFSFVRTNAGKTGPPTRAAAA